MKIIKAPNDVLKAPNLIVTNVDEEVRPYISKMKRLLSKTGGVAIAANQVGINLRFFISKDEVYINPIMEITDDTLVEGREGCLSLPGGVYIMKRYQAIKLTYTNIRGHEKQINARIPNQLKNLRDQAQLTKCLMIQHEMGHLNGQLISEEGTSFKGQTVTNEDEPLLPTAAGLPVMTLDQLQRTIRTKRNKEKQKNT